MFHTLSRMKFLQVSQTKSLEKSWMESNPEVWRTQFLYFYLLKLLLIIFTYVIAYDLLIVMFSTMILVI